MPVFTLCTIESLCYCLLRDRVAIPCSLYKLSSDTDLVNPVTSRAAPFWISFVVLLSLLQSIQPKQLTHTIQ